jgi:hypothetical protein
MRRVIALCTAIGAFLSETTVLAQQPLTDPEIRELLVGKTAFLDSGATLEFAVDGRYTYRKAGRTDLGKYRISGGQVCISFDSGRSRCDRIMRDTQGPYLLEASGQINHFAESSLNECGQSLKFTVRAPSPDLPANMKAFSGVWAGAWRGTWLCSVLIVEAVQSDGTANALYGWGTDRYTSKPGSTRFKGKIVGDRFSPFPGSVRVEFVLESPTKLEGKYTYDAGGITTGSFMRR